VSTASAVRPGRVWYVVGAIILIGGITAGLVVALVVGRGMIDDMATVTIPGETVVTFEEPGTYTVFQERDASSRMIQWRSDDTYRLEILHRESGQPVNQGRPGGSVTYTFDNRSGSNLTTLRISQAGEYIIRTDGAASDDLVLRVDERGRMGRAFFGAMFGGIGGAIGSGLLGSVLLISVGIARYVNRRKTPPGPGPAVVSSPTAAPPPRPGDRLSPPPPPPPTAS
jgi:hypothetical protein